MPVLHGVFTLCGIGEGEVLVEVAPLAVTDRHLGKGGAEVRPQRLAELACGLGIPVVVVLAPGLVDLVDTACGAHVIDPSSRSRGHALLEE